ILTGGASTQTAAGTYAVTADFVPTDTTNYNTLTSLAAGNFVIINPYNAWAASKGLTGGNAAQTADPDGDGRINLLEFATNDDPNSGNASGKQKAAVGTVSTQQVFTLTVPVRTGATFSGTNDQVSAAIDGVIYTIQGTTDLVAGFTNTVVPVSEVTGGDATAIQTGMPALESGWTYRTFRATGYTVSGSPFVFLRLKVTASP
ncbi:MAG: hypothetical protein WCN98_15190, partial [Verrucomicrobiaceae bacterium]